MEPGPGALLAVAVFYKYLDAPIERVIFDERRKITYENAASAQVYGVELEVGGDFGAVSPSLRDLSASLGVVLTSSRVSLKPEQVRIQTSPERPLQGQAPYAVQATVGYAFPSVGAKVSVGYGVFGPRIVEVGSNFLPDVYEQPIHRVDVGYTQKLAKGWGLKLSAKNALNQPVSLRGGAITVLRYRPGADIAATLSYTL
jgi:outer membrane receptor protein involved in Fe transport